MNDLLFSLQTVFPLLVMMAVGYLARVLRWVDENAMRKINACVFRIFLPLTLFFNIYDTELGAGMDIRTLLFAFVTTLIMFGALFLLVPRLCRERRSISVMIQGIARSNYALFGIPLVMMMYPDGDISIAVLMVVAVVPVFNVLSTVALMAYGEQKASFWPVCKSILLNPLIIGTALGLIFWQLRIPLPELISIPLRKLGGIASPLALFILGATLDFSKARANRKLLTLSVLGRLVIVPLVFLSIAIMIGIRNVSLAALIAVYASPTSISSFPMAQEMGGDGDLAGAQVVFTTVFSIVTVFAWVYALRAMGYLA